MAEIEHIMGWPAPDALTMEADMTKPQDQYAKGVDRTFICVPADDLEQLRHQLAQSQAEAGALRGLVKQGLSAVSASYSQALAEFHGHDRTADKLDKAVAEWRTLARAALAPDDAGGGAVNG